MWHYYNLIKCSNTQMMKATECFDCEDWRRKFQINIKFEIAADMGGLSREWFEILCIKLFDPKEGWYQFSALYSETK